jgi:hypothetical protein
MGKDLPRSSYRNAQYFPHVRQVHREALDLQLSMDALCPPRELCILIAGNLSVCDYESKAGGTGSRFLIMNRYGHTHVSTPVSVCLAFVTRIRPSPKTFLERSPIASGEVFGQV